MLNKSLNTQKKLYKLYENTSNIKTALWYIVIVYNYDIYAYNSTYNSFNVLKS